MMGDDPHRRNLDFSKILSLLLVPCSSMARQRLPAEMPCNLEVKPGASTSKDDNCSGQWRVEINKMILNPCA